MPAPTLVQVAVDNTAGNYKGGVSGSASFTTDPAKTLISSPAGHTLFVLVTVRETTTGAFPSPTVTDSAGNSYTYATTNGNGSNTAPIYVFRCSSPTAPVVAGGTTWTFNTGATGAVIDSIELAVGVTPYASMAPSQPAPAAVSQASSTTHSMSLAAAAVGDWVLIVDTYSGGDYTNFTGWTNATAAFGLSANTNRGMAIGYDNPGSTASVTRTATWNTAHLGSIWSQSYTVTNLAVSPTCDAGADQTHAVGKTVVLTGTDAPVSGSIAGRAWTFDVKPAGSTATFTGGSTANATFTPDVAGVYVPRYTVTNTVGGSASATLNVNAVANTPNAGAAQALTVGLPLPTLDASASVAVGGSGLWSYTATNGVTGLTPASATSPITTYPRPTVACVVTWTWTWTDEAGTVRTATAVHTYTAAASSVSTEMFFDGAAVSPTFV